VRDVARSQAFYQKLFGISQRGDTEELYIDDPA
jgi:hypothetical protein